MEAKGITQRINETMSWFLEKKNKIDKPSAKQKYRVRRHKFIKIREEA
jgi:hypothetical protein